MARRNDERRKEAVRAYPETLSPEMERDLTFDVNDVVLVGGKSEHLLLQTNFSQSPSSFPNTNTNIHTPYLSPQCPYNNQQNTLTPTKDAHTRRQRFIAKIQRILTDEWPDKEIKVHSFGSTVNGLLSRTSDVDLCLTTPWEDRERGVANMHVLAGCLRRYGMTKIYTVTKAKVPICKFYDPE
ncbi:hypothetical protein HDU67_008787 [Dinochytrium kinnereticum]|nr:hypothetical protein HDU67_008787 [Dinochytrium kinnereticum]